MTRLFRASFLKGLRDENEELALYSRHSHLNLFWPTVLTIGISLLGISVWLIAAKIPVTVEARGVLLRVGGVREIVAFGQGAVSDRVYGPGEGVRAGDVLFGLSSPDAAGAYLDARRAFLSEMLMIDSEKGSVVTQFESREKELTMRLDGLRTRVAELRKVSVALKGAVEKNEFVEKGALSSQRVAIEDVKRAYDELERGASVLKDRGFISKQGYAQIVQNRVSSIGSLGDVLTGLSKLNVASQKTQREIVDLDNEVSSAEADMQSVVGTIADERNRLKTELQRLDLQLEVGRNRLLDAERRMWFRQTVITPFDGEIISLRKAPGQSVVGGEAVALVSLVPQHRCLLLVLSPRAKKGSITFAYKDRQARVIFKETGDDFARLLTSELRKVVEDDGIEVRVIGNRSVISMVGNGLGPLESLRLIGVDLVDEDGVAVFGALEHLGDEWDGGDLEMAVLLNPRDAKKVRAGQVALIKPDFERSLIGSQVRATVIRASDYIVTAMEMQSLLGSEELTRAMSATGGAGVVAILSLDRLRGGELSVDGGELSRPLSVGTLGRARVEIEHTSPIRVLFSFLIDSVKRHN